MLRVLHVLCDLNGGGAERLVLDLCRLSAPDVLPSVVTVHDSPGDAGGALASLFREAGVSVISVGRRRRRPGGLALGRLTRMARQVDVVHTHLWAGDTWGRGAGLLAGLLGGSGPLLVSTEHNTRADSAWRGALTRGLDRWTDAVVGVSRAALRHRGAGVEPGGASRAWVIANGIDLARFPASAEPPGPPWRLLAVGRLTHQKGLDVLIGAMHHLPPEVSLDILGEGPERAPLTAAALGGRVRLVGWTEDVAGWLRRSHVVVLPSRWEGFGLVAIEAMAVGRPIVASRVPGLAEALGSCALTVPPDAPIALAGAIQELLGGAARRSALRACGAERSQELDVRRTVAAYEALYRSLLAGRRAGQ